MTKGFLPTTSASGTFPDDSLPVKYALFGYFLPPQMPLLPQLVLLWYRGYLSQVYIVPPAGFSFCLFRACLEQEVKLFDEVKGAMRKGRGRWESSGMTVISPPCFLISPCPLHPAWSPLSSFLPRSLIA